MARTVPVSAQPLPGGEGAGTITIEVAAKLLMVTPECVRRLTKDGWIAKTERGRYRVVDVVQGYIRFLKGIGCGTAGVRQIGWHVLRHTFATQLTLRGVPLTIVKELLGHSTITTTMRYSHVAPSALRSAIEMLNPRNAAMADFGQPVGNQ